MNEQLNDLLDAIDMEWLLNREGISYKVSYGRSGMQLNAKECPFCHHSEYKVYINAETGIGNCFSGSCPKGTFNKWSFMKGLFDVGGRDLVNIMKSLAREQGWRPKANINNVGLQDINTLELPDATPAWEMNPIHEYLARRGITSDIAQYFGLHWCESGAWNFLDPRGFEGSQDYSNRILIPVFDLDGSMVSFQGRDTTGEAERRYLFPPGFASAGAYIYNGQNVRDHHETAVISEGVFDVVQTKRALDETPETKNFVALGTFGMHLSSGNPTGDDQLGRLRRLKREKNLKRVVFLWDGELKANAAAVEAALRCSEVGLHASVAFIGDGMDPGKSYTKSIQEAVLKATPCRSKLEAIKVLRHAKNVYTTA